MPWLGSTNTQHRRRQMGMTDRQVNFPLIIVATPPVWLGLWILCHFLRLYGKVLIFHSIFDVPLSSNTKSRLNTDSLSIWGWAVPCAKQHKFSPVFKKKFSWWHPWGLDPITGGRQALFPRSLSFRHMATIPLFQSISAHWIWAVFHKK